MADKKRPFLAPRIYGGKKSEDVIDFFIHFERVSNANLWDEKDKLLYLPFYLEGSPLKYLDMIQLSLTEANRWDYKNVRSELEKYYQPIHMDRYEMELTNIRMKPCEAAREYMAQVLGLCSKVDPHMSEGRKIKYVLKGLLPHIQDRVIMLPNESIDELERNLQRFEFSQYIVEDRVGLGKASIVQRDSYDHHIMQISRNVDKLIAEKELAGRRFNDSNTSGNENNRSYGNKFNNGIEKGQRFNRNRYEGNRFEGNRVEGNRYEGNRFEGNRFEGNRFEGNRFDRRNRNDREGDIHHKENIKFQKRWCAICETTTHTTAECRFNLRNK
ncbi:uncharacterized protein LOC120351396 [Nilaparvata lugens]|uniref:uncharacterized protein LOC120351396 n=1 Tax=Nilaparvata lugens TaxID=108931 RepID=UPI00193DD481|nr:uncharacterized protein LOC120351396 [Nilaparvata lugens]